jgi:hypothetical protein
VARLGGTSRNCGPLATGPLRRRVAVRAECTGPVPARGVARAVRVVVVAAVEPAVPPVDVRAVVRAVDVRAVVRAVDVRAVVRAVVVGAVVRAVVRVTRGGADRAG